jgi:hypothetical protein
MKKASIADAFDGIDSAFCCPAGRGSELHVRLAFRELPHTPLMRCSRGTPAQKLLAVLLTEFIHTATGVNDLLLAGVKGMALGTHIEAQITFVGGTGFKGVAAAANHLDLIVGRMNVRLHGVILYLQMANPVVGSARSGFNANGKI